MFAKILRSFLIIFCCVALCACSDQTPIPTPSSVPSEAPLLLPDGTVVDADCENLDLNSASAEITDLFNKLPKLKSVSFKEVISAEDFASLRSSHPSVRFDAEIKFDQISFKSSDTHLELQGLKAESVPLLAEILPGMYALESVNLGIEESCPELSLSDVGLLQQSRSDVDFEYGFSLYGKSVSTCDEVLDLNHIEVTDEGAAVFEAMKYMPRLEYLDMDSCGVSNEAMAEIRDAYPDVKVVWRIWFADLYTVRTDVEMILASKPDVGGIMSAENVEALKYCTDVKYLDVGHNHDLPTIEFVRYMPKLEVAILAMADWTDCSPLAECKELEYLEIQTTQTADISALSGLTKLKHLNICYLFDLKDISPLYNLTGLERLWIGCITPIPDEQIEKMQQLAPNCEINTSTEDPTMGGWRYSEYGELVPRYELLRQQFGNYDHTAFSLVWNDPKC